MILYGLALAGGALLLEWLDYKHAVRAWSTELYVGIVAILFVALGIWVGNRLTPQPRGTVFERNDAAIRSLGISDRECEVLDLLASVGSRAGPFFVRTKSFCRSRSQFMSSRCRSCWIRSCWTSSATRSTCAATLSRTSVVTAAVERWTASCAPQ